MSKHWRVFSGGNLPSSPHPFLINWLSPEGIKIAEPFMPVLWRQYSTPILHVKIYIWNINTAYCQSKIQSSANIFLTYWSDIPHSTTSWFDTRVEQDSENSTFLSQLLTITWYILWFLVFVFFVLSECNYVQVQYKYSTMIKTSVRRRGKNIDSSSKLNPLRHRRKNYDASTWRCRRRR